LYEGHWVKVKVTAATEREHQYSRNVKRQSAITPVYRRCEIWVHGVFG